MSGTSRTEKNESEKQGETMIQSQEENKCIGHANEEAKTMLAEKEDQILELEAEVRRMKMENAELKNKLHTEEPYEKIFNERQDLMEKFGEKIAQIRELETQHKSLHESIVTFKSRNASLEEENGILKTEKANFEKLVKEITEERLNLQTHAAELEKHNDEFGKEMNSLKSEFIAVKTEKERLVQEIEENKQKETRQNMMYIEELRKEIQEYKTKQESMLLESEALKSENESLFRANESKKDEMSEIQKELSDIKKELQLEKLRYAKLKQEWDEEKSRTEFVLVSKDKRKRDKKKGLETFTKENDSEDEHVVSIVEVAKAESEALKENERELKRRVSQLQTDKEELFRSGTSLFAENRTLKSKYDSVLGERTTLLQVEAALKRKVREQESEIQNLKKTIDDLYQQNMTIRTNEEKENKTHAYVVLMGNEMIKQLEREKSALNRRVKFLERENNDIETRVIELERQSKTLIDYSRKYEMEAESINDARQGPDFAKEDDSQQEDYTSLRKDQYSQTHRLSRRDMSEIQRTPSANVQIGYRELSRMSYRVTRSPDFYTTKEPPFKGVPSRQFSYGSASVKSTKSHESKVLFPSIDNTKHSPLLKPFSSRSNDSRHMTPTSSRR